MKQLPILCSTCRKYKTKRDRDGLITEYSCFGSSMSRARKEKQCVSYAHDSEQETLVYDGNPNEPTQNEEAYLDGLDKIPSDSDLLGW